MSDRNEAPYTPGDIILWARLVWQAYAPTSRENYEDPAVLICPFSTYGVAGSAPGIMIKLKRFLFRTELVFEARTDINPPHVSCFRPGKWMERLRGMAPYAEAEIKRKEAVIEQMRLARLEAAERELQERFRPIPD